MFHVVFELERSATVVFYKSSCYNSSIKMPILCKVRTGKKNVYANG